uniref:Uncharacterized protein n=1 Tax=Globodera rostochiensis TaxID=31243 RepID=A0A914HIU7_GLORO
MNKTPLICQGTNASERTRKEGRKPPAPPPTIQWKVEEVKKERKGKERKEKMKGKEGRRTAKSTDAQMGGQGEVWKRRGEERRGTTAADRMSE